MIEPLSPFIDSMALMEKDKTKETLWAFTILVDSNIADFIDALGYVEYMWFELNEADKEIKKPSKDSVVFEGNGTVN